MRRNWAGLGLLLLAACGSRFRAAHCPGTPFPEAAELLREPGFDSLGYFQGGADNRRPVEVELWADAKFEFQACLRYHYPRNRAGRTGCPAGVSLLLRQQGTAVTGGLGEGFIAFFARRLNTDLTTMQTAFREARDEGSAHAIRMLEPGLVGEVVTLRSANRGPIVVVGFYERPFFESALERVR